MLMVSQKNDSAKIFPYDMQSNIKKGVLLKYHSFLWFQESLVYLMLKLRGAEVEWVSSMTYGNDDICVCHCEYFGYLEEMKVIN